MSRCEKQIAAFQRDSWFDPTADSALQRDPWGEKRCGAAFAGGWPECRLVDKGLERREK